MALPQVILVTGPARSGKSEWAERLAVKSSQSIVYVATSKVDATDVEWQQRIEGHRQRRPADWELVERPTDLAGLILSSGADRCLLIDSLGTWLANFLEEPEENWAVEQGKFLAALAQAKCTVILVAEETGWGLVPVYPLGRLFRDRLGTLTRKVGAIANPVYLVTAGHVLDLTKLGQPLEDGENVE
jgi:adenosylcobinamide kinase / adenosylcobinamide-phosphate guanylyltransferase